MITVKVLEKNIYFVDKCILRLIEIKQFSFISFSNIEMLSLVAIVIYTH